VSEQRLPPVTALAMLSLALVLCGGIHLAADVPDDVALVPAVVPVTNLVLLARVRDFAGGASSACPAGRCWPTS